MEVKSPSDKPISPKRDDKKDVQEGQATHTWTDEGIAATTNANDAASGNKVVLPCTVVRTLPSPSSNKLGSNSSKKRRLKQGRETWLWLKGWNEAEEKIDGENHRQKQQQQRLGILGGKIKAQGEIVKIDLHQCQLADGIPYTLPYISSLRVLILFENNLTGPLPDALGDLPQLEHLDVSHNQLSGSIPSSFTRLIHMKRLHLEHNQLIGPLPLGFLDGMTELTHFTASNNQLCGPLPDFSACCQSIQQIELQENYFEGPLLPPSLLSTYRIYLPHRLQRLVLVKNCLTTPDNSEIEASMSLLRTSCSFPPSTPRSGLALHCQLLPQRSEAEQQTYYASQASYSSYYYNQQQQQEIDSSHLGWYDEQGQWYSAADYGGYYDATGQWITYDHGGYYDDQGNWIATSTTTT